MSYKVAPLIRFLPGPGSSSMFTWKEGSPIPPVGATVRFEGRWWKVAHLRIESHLVDAICEPLDKVPQHG